MSQTLKKVWNVITTVAVVLVVVLAVLLVGVRIIGFQAFTVLSGSMDINMTSIKILRMLLITAVMNQANFCNRGM